MKTTTIGSIETRNRKKRKTKRLLSIKETVKVYGGTPWFWLPQVWAGRVPVMVVVDLTHGT